jgi:peptide/nickel transport system permease protein
LLSDIFELPSSCSSTEIQPTNLNFADVSRNIKGKGNLRDYLIKRIIASIFILIVVMTLNFILFRVVHPIKDPAMLILDPKIKRAGYEQAMRELWGLNAPLFPDQYLKYMWNLLTWQYGYDFGTPPKPVADQMSWRLANSIFIMGAALVGNIAIGLPLGVLAGSRRGQKSDVVVMGIGLFTWGFPIFFIQIIFLLFFSYYSKLIFGIQLLPPYGVVSIPPPTDPFALFVDKSWHAIGPITTLILAGFGSWALFTRNLMVDALTEDYIVTAKAKGVSNRDVLYKHAFRNILPPVATMIAMAIPGIVTGAVITESIFGWPGIGQWYINALNTGNHPVTQAVLYNYAVLMILANLVADILYGFLDPRIRVGVRR